MKLEQNVFFLNENKIENGIIMKIQKTDIEIAEYKSRHNGLFHSKEKEIIFSIQTKNIDEGWSAIDSIELKKEQCFSTKQELLNSL